MSGYVRKVRVVDYDPAWPSAYADEAARVQLALGDTLISHHHVGSTSVPGLPAKPIIDVLAIVRSLVDADARRPEVEAARYLWRGEFGIPGRRYLVRLAADGVEHACHVHMFAPGHQQIDDHLTFRDHLRGDAAARAAYAALKKDLATRHAEERQRYQQGKDAMIEAMLREARQRRQR